jgi:hypothetical protein
MVIVEAKLLDAAVVAMLNAAESARTKGGLRILVHLPKVQPAPTKQNPHPEPILDRERVRSIVLGAMCALCNDAVGANDEVQLEGFWLGGRP